MKMRRLTEKEMRDLFSLLNNPRRLVWQIAHAKRPDPDRTIADGAESIQATSRRLSRKNMKVNAEVAKRFKKRG